LQHPIPSQNGKAVRSLQNSENESNKITKLILPAKNEKRGV